MNTRIYILWDAAHIWGHMVLRAVKAMRLPYRLVSAKEIQQGVLLRKPPVLMVPGGSARHKSVALGEAGRRAVQDYVQEGGVYIGFCGGAGLGLSDKGGLGLCPWVRAPYVDRMQHLVSGHVLSRRADHPLCPPQQADTAHTAGMHANAGAGGGTAAAVETHAELAANAAAGTAAAGMNTAPAGIHAGTAAGAGAGTPLCSLPVWWPGRFAPQEKSPRHDVHILASYVAPDKDLCLTDLPLSALPPDIFRTWQDLYGINMRADFLTDQPCVIHGQYGQGDYVLSYSHLETPDSPDANAWMAHLLRTLGGFAPHCTHTPPWRIEKLPTLWCNTKETRALFTARAGVNKLMRLGVTHNLLFKRTPWLWGWRTGIPGAALNNLHTALNLALSLPPTPQALELWREHAPHVQKILPAFLQGSADYLLAERLATTLASGLGDAITRYDLKAQRQGLFGLPMEGGGLYQDLVDMADALIFALEQ